MNRVARNAILSKNAEPQIESAVKKSLAASLKKVHDELVKTIPIVHGQTASVVKDVVPVELMDVFKQLTDTTQINLIGALVRRLS